MSKKYKEFDWIELAVRPKKDGLHDSGYRFIRLTGHSKKGDSQELNQWSDHAVFYGPVNIDVTPEGIIRIMPWFGPDHGPDFTEPGSWLSTDAVNGEFLANGEFFASAVFYVKNFEAVANEVRDLNRIHAEVYGYASEQPKDGAR